MVSSNRPDRKGIFFGAPVRVAPPENSKATGKEIAAPNLVREMVTRNNKLIQQERALCLDGFP